MIVMLLAAIALALARPAAADLNYERFRKLTDSLLKVEAHNPDGSVSIGTGVIVGHRYVITNCHVTQRAASVELIKGGQRMTAESQHADVARDLCVLRAPQVEQFPTADVAVDRPRVGQVVYAVGYVFGIAARVSEGSVRALFDYDAGQIIQSATPFTSGASGGGLFDERGRLVGIVTFRYPGGEAHHFSLPVGWVSEAIAKFDGRPVRPLPGEPFWRRPEASRPHFLRAASLEAERRWPELAEVARQWCASEPGNASSWLMLGRAYQELRQYGGAIEAARAAARIDPRRPEAWYRLALAYAANGDAAEAERARANLNDVDQQLAQELARRAGRCGAEGPITC